jgi:hypothetical protein
MAQGPVVRRCLDPVRRLGVPLLGSLASRRECIVVYDLASSPLTFGDYLYVALVARAFQALGRRTTLVVIDDARRPDMEGIEVEHRLEQFAEIAHSVALPGRLSFERASFVSLGTHTWPGYPPRRIRARRGPGYVGAWNDLEVFLRLAPRVVRRRFLLRAGEVARAAGVALPDEPYGVLAVRTGSSYRADSDMTREEVQHQLATLRQHLRDLPILVASDAAGTEMVRGWDLDDPALRFVQDLGKSFASNLAVALGGRFYVQVRGGGLCAGPLFAERPMLLAAEPANETRRAARSGGWRPPWGHAASLWCPPGEALAQLERFAERMAA